MKLNAYILAADPAWIEASVLSYYDLVDRIVVSYDENGRGWTGVPIDVEQCLRRLRAIDKVGKFDYRPGKFARPEFFDRPMENDTYQRQIALDQASNGAEWVLQLDTDEVVGNADIFRESLAEAEHVGLSALNYPAIWLYAHAFGRWYLEWCRRGWRRAAGFPGPLAVASGSVLSHARRVAQPDGAYFHVDVATNPSAVAYPKGVSVNRVIPAASAVFHFSWVRSEAWLRAKFSTWGHAKDKNWNPEVGRWVSATGHPIISCFLSQFERGPGKRPLRFVRIPDAVARFVDVSANDRFSAEPEVILSAPCAGSIHNPSCIESNA
jgi:hypothetical protein